MTDQEIDARYKAFLEEYNASLPAHLTDEQRKELLLAALQERVGQDIDQVSSQALEELDVELDSLSLQEGAAGRSDEEDEMERIRKGL